MRTHPMPSSDEKYTRCPGCLTIFRVAQRQLDRRGGQVRCGHCQTVFDGTAEQIVLAPLAKAGGAEGDSQLTQELVARVPASVAPAAPSPPAPFAHGPTTAERRIAERALLDDSADEISYEERFAGTPRGLRRLAGLLYTYGTPLLALLLFGHMLFHFRDLLAARWPGGKPVLAAFCEFAGCAISPIADMSALTIEASDLQADPVRKGLLTLTATIRNRANWALAYPYFELTLTDAQDHPVVRRAFAPPEYAGAAIDVRGGIPANGEIAARMYLDASATSQAGYRLYLFYP